MLLKHFVLNAAICFILLNFLLCFSRRIGASCIEAVLIFLSLQLRVVRGGERGQGCNGEGRPLWITRSVFL